MGHASLVYYLDTIANLVSRSDSVLATAMCHRERRRCRFSVRMYRFGLRRSRRNVRAHDQGIQHAVDHGIGNRSCRWIHCAELCLWAGDGIHLRLGGDGAICSLCYERPIGHGSERCHRCCGGNDIASFIILPNQWSSWGALDLVLGIDIGIVLFDIVLSILSSRGCGVACASRQFRH